MSRQKVVDNSDPRQWRTEIPNTVVRGSKSGISVHAKWLYVYLKSVAGDSGSCWQGTKTMSEGTGISTGKISSCKKELEQAGLISISKGDTSKGRSDTITITNIWRQNINEFSDDQTPSPHEHPPSPHEHPLHHMNDPLHQVNLRSNPLRRNPMKKGDAHARGEDVPQSKPESEDDVISFFKQNGLGENQALEFYHHFESQGWMRKNGMRITSWQSAANLWIQRELHDKPEWKSKNKKGNGKPDINKLKKQHAIWKASQELWDH